MQRAALDSLPDGRTNAASGSKRSRLWRQIQVDVYGKEVEIVEAEEVAAYGAAILAGVGARMWNTVDEECAAVVRVAARVKPAGEAMATLNKSYQAYRRVYAATRSIFSS